MSARRLFVLLLIGLGGTGVLHAEESGVSYHVRLPDDLDGDLSALLNAVSDCVTLADRPPATIGLLRQRMRRDVAAFREALGTRARFAPVVEGELVDRGSSSDVVFTVDPGPVYRFRSVRIEVVPGPGAESGTATGLGLPTADSMGLRPGAAALARTILDAQSALEARLPRAGHPLGNQVDRDVVVIHEARAVDLTLRVRPGPRARFGPIRFHGLVTVEEAYLRSELPFAAGDPYDPKKLDSIQAKLVSKRLFSTVLVKTADQVAPDGTLDVDIHVEERKHRTFEAGATYRTDSGGGVRLGWKHRNFRQVGEKLDVEVTGNGVGAAVSTAYQKPEFLREDQRLLVRVRAARDDPIAFTSTNLGTSVEVERDLGSNTSVRGGVSVKVSQVDQNHVREHFGLVSLPLQLDHDSADNLLDPTEGHRLSLSVIPFADPFGQNLSYVKSTMRHRAYFNLSDDRRSVLATRLALGFLSGATRTELPADERFYTGGGGAVRGYPYKSIGLARGVEVLGGRSLLETSMEFRRKFTKKTGMVAFIDGGAVFDTFLEDTRSFFWGAGIGARYYTSAGPLRLDVAVPLNRRLGIDDSYQVYMSLGQAF